MITALECWRQSALYEDAATAEDHTRIRANLLALSRSWSAIAKQIEQLADLRMTERPAPLVGGIVT